MKKNNYSAPTMEQVSMEAEMPVMQTSGGGGSSFPSNLESFIF